MMMTVFQISAGQLLPWSLFPVVASLGSQPFAGSRVACWSVRSSSAAIAPRIVDTTGWVQSSSGLFRTFLAILRTTCGRSSHDHSPARSSIAWRICQY